MKCSGTFRMTVLLVFGLFAVIASAHDITLLEVPRYGDPRADVALVCYYLRARGDPPLHSVKWYRGKDEIFRYIPDQQPPTRTFNTSLGAIDHGSCGQDSCSIRVTLPRTYNTRVTFTCEVSTEGPRFAVVKQTKNITVAVPLEEDPVILGVPASVQLGEDLLINCTTSPAMPPANIVWFIDGKPERTEPWLVNNTQVSLPDEYGLRSSWRALRLRAGGSTGQAAFNVRCEATQPTWPPLVRTTNSTLVLVHSPHLSMFTASGSISDTGNIVMLAICLTVYIYR